MTRVHINIAILWAILISLCLLIKVCTDIVPATPTETVITSMTIDNQYPVTEVTLKFDTDKPIIIVDGKAKITVLIETGKDTYVQEGTISIYQFDNSFISHR